MILDKNKKITKIEYNFLNLPSKISFAFSDNPDSLSEGSIDFVYDAAGIKLSKRVSQKGLQKTYPDKNTSYAGNFIYQNDTLQFFSHSEGYVEPDSIGGGFKYVYQYKDIWNNVRLSYSDSTGNGIITQDEIVQERNYYPFGLVHKGYNDFIKGKDYKLKTYQGQEFTTDLGLDAHEWKFRMSDPASGRFWQIDPLSEDYTYNSTYAFQENKLGSGIELEGKEVQLWGLVEHGLKQNGIDYTKYESKGSKGSKGVTKVDGGVKWGAAVGTPTVKVLGVGAGATLNLASVHLLSVGLEKKDGESPTGELNVAIGDGDNESKMDQEVSVTFGGFGAAIKRSFIAFFTESGGSKDDKIETSTTVLGVTAARETETQSGKTTEKVGVNLVDAQFPPVLGFSAWFTISREIQKEK